MGGVSQGWWVGKVKGGGWGKSRVVGGLSQGWWVGLVKGGGWG